MTIYRIGKQKPALTTAKPWDAIDVATSDASDVQTKLNELEAAQNLVSGNPFKYFQRLRLGAGLNQLTTSNVTLNSANNHKFTHTLVTEQNTIGGIVHDVPFFSDYHGEFKADATVAVTLRLTVRFYHFSNTANEFSNIQSFERRFSAGRQTTVALADLSSPPIQVPLGTLSIPGGPTFNITEEFLNTPFPFRIELDIESFDTATGAIGTDTVLSNLELVDPTIAFWQLNRLALGRVSPTQQPSAAEEQHFVSAVFVNSTRTLTFTRANGNTLDVIIPESTSGFLAPSISEFSLPGTPSRIDTTADLIGNISYQFHISNSADLDTLALEANGINIGAITTFTPDGIISGTIDLSSTEWTSIIGVNATQVEFQLVGLDKNTPTAGAVTSSIITVQIQDVAQDEFFYYGVSTSNNPASIDVSTLNSISAATGSFDLLPIDPAAGDFIIFLAPQDHDLTALTNRGTGVDELAAYTETQSVRTISGQLFDSYVLGPTRDTAPVSYNVTLA